MKLIPMKLLGGLAVTALAALVPTSAMAGSISICDGISGNIIQNCGFETGGAGNDAPPSWTTSQFLAGDDEIIGSPLNSGSFSLEIANDKNLPGLPLFNGSAIISQSFSDIAGATYQFTFYVFDAAGGNTSNQLFQAFWDSTSGAPIFANSGGGAPASGFTQETFSVTGTGSDSITFTAYNTPNFYYLDDVSVVETAGPTSSTPEPSGVILLGTGTLALLCLKLRNQWLSN
jgi:hypothetical protein